MSNIGIEVLKIALNDAAKKQQLITAELHEFKEHPNIRRLVAEQSALLKEMMSILNRIA